MNPIKLAIVWCVYMAVFWALAESLDAYRAYDWILKMLSISKHETEWTELKTVSFLTLTLTLTLIWSTAKYAYNFTGASEWQNGSKARKRIKLIAMWLAFLAPFLVIVFLLLLVLPEAWLHRLITGHEGMSCDDVVWGGIFMGITLALALPINGVFVAFVSSKAMKRKQLRQSAQQKTACKTAEP
jgi:ABC-type Fe3+ transport system permease subunit